MNYVATKWNVDFFVEIDIVKSDNTIETKVVNINDIIKVGYVENEELKEYQGRFADLSLFLRKVPTVGNTDNPVNTIATDIQVLNILLDVSKKYDSKFVELNAREIVEPSDVSDVSKVMVKPNIKVSITISDVVDGVSSDTTLNDIKVGTELTSITIRENNKEVTFDATVVKFLYNSYDNRIKVSDIVLKDTEGKIHVVKFRDIIGITGE